MANKQQIEVNKKWFLKLFFHVMSKTANGLATYVFFKYLENEDAYYLKIYSKRDFDTLEVELFDLFQQDIEFKRIQSNPPVIEDNVKGLELLVSAKKESEYNKAIIHLSLNEIIENWSNEIDSLENSMDNIFYSFLEFEKIGCARIYMDLVFHLIHDFEMVALQYRMNVAALEVKAYQHFSDKRNLEELESNYATLFENLFSVGVCWSGENRIDDEYIDDNKIEPEFFFENISKE
jgi:hypothetical protein